MQPMEIEEEFNNISVCPFHEEQQEAAKVNDEPFDESTVFDPAMTTPRYDVATIVSPEMEASSVHKHCSEVNEALASIGTKSRHCFDSAGFHNLMHNRNNSEIHQIDVTENVTRF